MKRLGIILTIFATCLVVGVFLGFCLIVSRNLKTETLSQLRAEIPPALHSSKILNTKAQNRYRQLIAIADSVDPADVDGQKWFSKEPKQRKQQAFVRKKYAPIFAKLEVLLRAGPLQNPPHTITDHSPRELINLYKAVADAESDAVLLHDAPNSRRLERLFLSLAQSLRKSKGALTDQWYAWNAEWEALTGYLGAEHESLLTDADRSELLAQLPPDRGIDPELADALKRGLTELTIPRLFSTAHPGLGSRTYPGRFDVRETVRLDVQLYQEAVRDALSPSPRSWEGVGKIQEAAYQRAMEAYRPKNQNLQGFLAQSINGNSFGDWLIANSTANQYLVRSRLQATYRNIVRAILLSRHGPPPVLPDPLGYDHLQIDTHRRMVWSVGLNGIDEKGKYGPAGSYAGDFSLSY